MPQFSVIEGDVANVPSDVLLLKHARTHCGVDWAVASFLVAQSLCEWSDTSPEVGDYRILDTHSRMAPQRVMFVGVPELADFGYREMYSFAFRAVEVLSQQPFPVRKITTTLHGTGTGLDYGEALQHLTRGFADGCAAWVGTTIRQVEFVELNARRSLFAASLLSGAEDLSAESITESWPFDSGASLDALHLASPAAAGPKDHVFVAMPFSEQFEDTYELGIYPALRECGYICERLDRTAFTGDILERMKDRIASAKFVLADLSESRPNVYLEVGYAWGLGVPVLLIARRDESLHFDVRTHRCIYYTSIRQLKRDLIQHVREM